MRIGQSHKDVAILLLGAFSRYVNHLTDEEIPKQKTKTLLKALRMFQSLLVEHVVRFLNLLQVQISNWQ
jgi:hypothetical protein